MKFVYSMERILGNSVKFPKKTVHNHYISKAPYFYMFKQAIVIRKDLEMTKGKLAAQACHACLKAYRESIDLHPSRTKEWLTQGGKKVVLWADDKTHLIEIKESISNNIPCEEIVDSGYTELEPGTLTCIGIGPAREEEIDKYTGKLKAVK